MRSSWGKALSVHGRSLPGDIAIVALLAIGFLLLRLPYRSEFLVNWDAVQLALGTQAFDLHHHQPHPPGYIGYVAVGWLLNHVTGEPNASLTLISAITGAAAPALFYLLALEVFRKRSVALAGAILLGTSPLAWYYSGVALTYMPECALALGFGLAAYRARTRASWPALVAAAVLLAVIGSFRQTGMAFLLPVFVWTLIPFAWPRRFASLAICGVATLAWLVPLLWLAGGLQAYIHESAALAELAGGPTSIVSGSPEGIGRNVMLVGAGFIFGLNAALALPFVARRRREPTDSAARELVLLWSVPAILVYFLGHTGQVGYVLFVLPPAILGLLLVADVAADAAKAHMPAAHWRMPVTLCLVVAINVATFAWGPGTALQLSEARAADEAGMSRAAVEQSQPKTGNSPLSRQLLQFSIRHSDAYWKELIEYIEDFDPERVVILTSPGGPRMAGSFRHLAYYLPEYRVLGMTEDRDGDFGQVFSSYRGANDYGIDKLADASSVILLDARVEKLIIPDPEVARRLGDIKWEQETLNSGAVVTTVEVPRNSTVIVLQDEDGQQLLAVRYPTLAMWKQVVVDPME